MVAAAAAASPSPVPAPHAAAGRPHPTYTKMITQALTELGGASRRGAIAARIHGRGYSGLPARHDDLLSAHLRLLLAEGVLLRLDADGPSSSCTYLLAPKPPAGGEEQKRGPGRPRKEKPGSAAASTSRGFKRGCGRPRKDQPVGCGGDGKDTSAAGAVGSDHLGSAGASVEPEGGTPRMEESASAARSLETTGDAAASTAGVKRGRGRPPKKKPATTGAKRGRGRPRKEKLASAAATTGVKRGRGRPRKEKPASAAATGVKRGRGRPKKAGSVGTWHAEAAAERDLFGDMAEEEEAPGDSLSAGKTMQAEGVAAAPGDREEAPGVSGGNAATAPAEAGNGSASLL